MVVFILNPFRNLNNKSLSYEIHVRFLNKIINCFHLNIHLQIVLQSMMKTISLLIYLIGYGDERELALGRIQY